MDISVSDIDAGMFRKRKAGETIITNPLLPQKSKHIKRNVVPGDSNVVPRDSNVFPGDSNVVPGDQGRVVLTTADPRGVGDLKMYRFRANRNFDSFRGNPDVKVTFHNPADKGSLSLFSICIHYLKEEKQLPQLLAYFLSAICCYLPRMKAESIKVLHNHGYTVEEANSNDEREGMGMALVKRFPNDECLAYFGQLVFVIFKKLNQRNYNQFIARRTNALKAFAGVPRNVEINQVLAYEAFLSINGSLTASRTFKATLFRQILAIAKTTEVPLTPVCNYICHIMEWNEMDPFRTIYNMLILPESPVLHEPIVRSESDAFYDAYRVITSHEYPQYFRILGEEHDQNFVNRCRFPNLLATARALQHGVSPTVDQYQPPAGVNKNTVQKLLDKHHHYFRTEKLPIPDFIKEMLNVEDE